jgi:membrane-associated phospholipid phosphatase
MHPENLPSADLALTVALNHWLASSSFLWTMALVVNGGTDLLIACTSIGMWFSSRAGARLRALYFLILLIPAYVLGRLLQHLFSRPRPFESIPLLFQPDQGWWTRESSLFSGKGSLPSDHAMLLALLVWAVARVNRRLAYAIGAYAAVYSIFRVGAGYHWPSDILVGLIIGFGIAVLMRSLASRFSAFFQELVRTLEAHPAPTYIVGFLFLFEFAQGFKHIGFVLERTLGVHLFH